MSPDAVLLQQQNMFRSYSAGVFMSVCVCILLKGVSVQLCIYPERLYAHVYLWSLYY